MTDLDFSKGWKELPEYDMDTNNSFTKLLFNVVAVKNF